MVNSAFPTRPNQQPAPETWEDPPMRQALAEHDITRVYRLLQELGYSQQQIAALTGQSQPEVSAIIHGRKVMGYDVLSRICDGLGPPRGYMGLAYDEAVTEPPGDNAVAKPPGDNAVAEPPGDEDAPSRPAQDVQRRAPDRR